jgi:hypothetical protein
MGPLVRRSLVAVLATTAVAGGGACSKKPSGEGPKSTADVLTGVDCAKVKAPAEPDLLAWEATSRTQLDKLRRQGVVAVRYEAQGCDVTMELLPECVGPKNKYVFTPFVEKRSTVAHDTRELVAALPVGAANVAGPLKESRVLRADTKIVGAVGLPKGTTVTEYDFVGPQCKQATHFIGTLFVGGFALAPMREAEAKGKSVFTADVIEGMTREGTPAICDRSEAEGIELLGCSVPLRAALIPFRSDSPAPVVRTPKPVSPRPDTDAGTTEPRTFDQNAVERVVREKQGAVKRTCWETSSDSLRRVNITVTTTISPQGRVVEARPQLVDSEGSADVAAMVARCIANEIQTWQFPEPERQQVITLPFHLIRQ